MADVLHYTMFIYWSEEDQAYLVALPDWADHVVGPVTHGYTYEEAVRNGQEALDSLIQTCILNGEPLAEILSTAKTLDLLVHADKVHR